MTDEGFGEFVFGISKQNSVKKNLVLCQGARLVEADDVDAAGLVDLELVDGVDLGPLQPLHRKHERRVQANGDRGLDGREEDVQDLEQRRLGLEVHFLQKEELGDEVDDGAW